MKTIDFEEQFGVNAGYVESLFDRWQEDPEAVDEEWRTWFEEAGGESGDGAAPTKEKPAKKEPDEKRAKEKKAAPEKKAAADDGDAAPESDEEREVERLKGVPARIAANMVDSLEVPTATSVRTLPVKVLDENRKIINAHMRDRSLGKASYTHFVAYAMVRAVKEIPNVQSCYEEHGGKGYKVTPKKVHLGIAIDVPAGDGKRSLVVPNVKDAGSMDFLEFYNAYQDVVERGREGKLKADDFAGTTFSLTNPGGFGTEMSVPRLMKGQGLILATGSIGLPVQVHGMTPSTLADLAVSPVMTVTSTYDHRTVQGAESGLLLKRLEELLEGEDGFWDRIFKTLRVPWTPACRQRDLPAEAEEHVAEKQAKVWQMISAYRTRGCQIADLDPLEYRPDLLHSLDPEWYGFTIWDLDREFLTDGMCGRPRMTLREILEVLRESYCRRWTSEYMHIVDRERKAWVRDRIEPRRNEEVFGLEDRKRILGRLIKAENFERFLHTRYPGNKRFSLEGADTLIPALSEILDRLAARGTRRVVIGMAHRGRLNVLANILNKSFERIFGTFEGVRLPGTAEGSGDVKYHIGSRGTYTTPDGEEIEVLLSANPSHLEAVDPVVCGQVRAFQDLDGDEERRHTMGILIHGDAAFTGQGVVAETIQMSNLPGYRTGGTIHLIVNNQIGFTAGPKDLYSTYYCSDLAKMVQAPVMHANGDYPESVMRACHVAVDFQQEFGADVVVDMVCYRRRGHNEGDEPAYTQPLLYQLIAKHPTVRENYTKLLVRRGDMTEEECDAVGEEFDEQLKGALEASRAKAKEQEQEDGDEGRDGREDGLTDAEWWDVESPDTAVDEDKLVDLVKRTNSMPPDVTIHPNLLRQLKRREEMVAGERDLDWGCAENLAYAALITEGTSIRLCGQDSGRGTFSHRHAVIRDQTTGDDYVPLAALDEKVHVEFRDTLLSEEAAVAYEYGYSLQAPQSLVIWEAQFGDFINGAQIPVDQFIVAGEEKWYQKAKLTLLLPHGYDGQGPEHSSARPERFLQLAAKGNMSVCWTTTAAQHFHLLRRQGRHDVSRPLVVFTPKSLLRDPRAASPVGDLSDGRFQEVLDDRGAVPEKVERVVLCSGKLYHDMAQKRDEEGLEHVALVRLEQLYPFPRKALLAALERYGEVELAWVQEEPRNMGAWCYLMQRFQELGLAPLRFIGRAPSPSPATGSFTQHQAEQEALVERALAK